MNECTNELIKERRLNGNKKAREKENMNREGGSEREYREGRREKMNEWITQFNFFLQSN